MFKRSRKAVAASLALMFLVGLAAYAQTQPRLRRVPKQTPAVAGQVQPSGIDPATKREYFFRVISLQRLLAPPNRRELERLVVMLGLTEEQKQQIKELYKQFFAKVSPISQERGAAVRELLTILQQPAPSKGALQAVANKVEQADRAILDAEFDFWLAFKSILNPQQQAQVSGYIQQKALQEMGPGSQMPGAPK